MWQDLLPGRWESCGDRPASLLAFEKFLKKVGGLAVLGVLGGCVVAIIYWSLEALVDLLLSRVEERSSQVSLAAGWCRDRHFVSMGITPSWCFC